MARLITPNARPRISSEADSMTMVDCMVPKQAVPMPTMSNIGKERMYHSDIENPTTANKAMADPMTK